MKKLYRLTVLVLALALALSACQGGETAGDGKLFISNMASEASLAEVRAALRAKLDADDVEAFLRLVKDYNETVENTGLRGEFENIPQPEYDLAKLDELWMGKKGDFIGTNCRINTFTLLNGSISINKAEADDRLLFMDNDAIALGKLFSEEKAALFRRLYSRVKTESTKDIKVHAAKMRAHFEGIRFSEKARMLSLVIHDTLDGDYLFVGHTGVLVPHGESYLFVEKLAFDQPYQALKFPTKEACYAYLYETYKHHYDETSAKPFIMDNAELVELKY